MSFDRPARSQVVQTGRTERIESESVPKWICDSCGSSNLTSRSHCTSCGTLRKEEREMRMVARANMGLGKGGGYFERGDSASRGKTENADGKKGGLDEYGRWRADEKTLTQPALAQPAVTQPALAQPAVAQPALAKSKAWREAGQTLQKQAERRHSLSSEEAGEQVPKWTSGRETVRKQEETCPRAQGKPLSKAEKQKMALARLRERPSRRDRLLPIPVRDMEPLRYGMQWLVFYVALARPWTYEAIFVRSPRGAAVWSGGASRYDGAEVGRFGACGRGYNPAAKWKPTLERAPGKPHFIDTVQAHVREPLQLMQDKRWEPVDRKKWKPEAAQDIPADTATPVQDDAGPQEDEELPKKEHPGEVTYDKVNAFLNQQVLVVKAINEDIAGVRGKLDARAKGEKKKEKEKES
ncbi:hypothetical protein AK812_SmicGene8691 [Symbiodinium microadriaticum]|uniref:RanBP2-type domain-containing protein n=1 Tax=Symbiodinium microadriaticum TaxID=2951 RepID=A0A1Q9EKB8_SYMMI|nr:hypothetical protein AK812_SmicGene8691 [Symbiodinium microadriaticum]